MRYLIAAAVLGLAGSSFADIINVPADYTTIQAAVDAAVDGDEVVVAPGTYTSTGDQVVNTYGKAITIRATGTPVETIIDGEGARRVIVCTHGEAANTIIEGFTITGGSASAERGGGIYCNYSSSPMITGCMISGNTARYGGGIYCSSSSSPTITGCTISNNTANYDGGGIYCPESSPTITICTISNNVVTGNTGWCGAGIYCWGGSPTLTEALVCGNDPDQIYPIDGWTDNGGNIVADECDPDDVDSDGDGVADGKDNCSLYNPDQEDCNGNGIGDICDIDSGLSEDVNQNGIADECECLSDFVEDGVVNVNDMLVVIGTWGTSGPLGDGNGDGNVDIEDLLIIFDEWGPCP